MKYRPEIDGLRAVAVLPVIFFHAGYDFFSGGYLGVDIFFVISGFLISTIILDELEQEKFSLVNFYERRARRILPALFFVVAVSIPFAWLWLPPGYMKEYSQSIVAVFTFSSNIFYWLYSGYFDTSTELMPLLHTWSLAVEEQFYLIFPIFLLAVWRFGKRVIICSLIIIFMLSLSAAQYYIKDHPDTVFYFLPTRAWELCIGVIAALLIKEKRFDLSLRLQNILSLIGLSAIVFSIFTFVETTQVPGAIALAPTLGSVMIIFYAREGTLVYKLLSAKIVVGIGLISYSLYLWHQPILALARHRFLGDISHVTVYLLTLIVLLAIISWYFVEKPFRSKRIKRNGVFAFSFSGIILFLLFGLYGHIEHGFKSREIEYLSFVDGIQLDNYEYRNKKLRAESWELLNALAKQRNDGIDIEDHNTVLWFDASDSREKMLIVGNSHSKDIFNVFHSSKAINTQFQLGRFGSQIHELDSAFFESSNVLDSNVIVIASQYDDDDLTSLDHVTERLIELGKAVIIVHRIYSFPNHEPYNLADQIIIKNVRKVENKETLVDDINIAYTQDYENNRNRQRLYIESRMRLNEIAKKYRDVKLFDRMSYVCPVGEGCYAIDSRFNKNFFDYGHHTKRGAEFFGSVVDRIGLDKLLE